MTALDPIFWGIERHRVAFDTFDLANAAYMDAGEQDEILDTAVTKAGEALIAAEAVLLASGPKTEHGTYALAGYLVYAAGRWGKRWGDDNGTHLKCLARACTRTAPAEYAVMAAMGAGL
jgi:hypothetical protein